MKTTNNGFYTYQVLCPMKEIKNINLKTDFNLT